MAPLTIHLICLPFLLFSTAKSQCPEAANQHNYTGHYFGAYCTPCSCANSMKCDRYTGYCLNHDPNNPEKTCKAGYWGGEVGCILENHHYYNFYRGSGVLYNGFATSRNCNSKWSQFIKKNPKYNNSLYLQSTILDKNWCRRRGTDSFRCPKTGSVNNDYIECNITRAECPRGRFGPHCEFECGCSSSTEFLRCLPQGGCSGRGCVDEFTPVPNNWYQKIFGDSNVQITEYLYCSHCTRNNRTIYTPECRCVEDCRSKKTVCEPSLGECIGFQSIHLERKRNSTTFSFSVHKVLLESDLHEMVLSINNSIVQTQVEFKDAVTISMNPTVPYELKIEVKSRTFNNYALERLLLVDGCSTPETPQILELTEPHCENDYFSERYRPRLLCNMSITFQLVSKSGCDFIKEFVLETVENELHISKNGTRILTYSRLPDWWLWNVTENNLTLSFINFPSYERNGTTIPVNFSVVNNIEEESKASAVWLIPGMNLTVKNLIPLEECPTDGTRFGTLCTQCNCRSGYCDRFNGNCVVLAHGKHTLPLKFSSYDELFGCNSIGSVPNWGPGCQLNSKNFYDSHGGVFYRGNGKSNCTMSWDETTKRPTFPEDDSTSFCRVPVFNQARGNFLMCPSSDETKPCTNIKRAQCPPLRFGINCEFECHCDPPNQLCNPENGQCIDNIDSRFSNNSERKLFGNSKRFSVNETVYHQRCANHSGFGMECMCNVNCKENGTVCDPSLKRCLGLPKFTKISRNSSSITFKVGAVPDRLVFGLASYRLVAIKENGNERNTGVDIPTFNEREIEIALEKNTTYSFELNAVSLILGQTMLRSEKFRFGTCGGKWDIGNEIYSGCDQINSTGCNCEVVDNAYVRCNFTWTLRMLAPNESNCESMTGYMLHASFLENLKTIEINLSKNGSVIGDHSVTKNLDVNVENGKIMMVLTDLNASRGGFNMIWYFQFMNNAPQTHRTSIKRYKIIPIERTTLSTTSENKNLWWIILLSSLCGALLVFAVVAVITIIRGCNSSSQGASAHDNFPMKQGETNSSSERDQYDDEYESINQSTNESINGNRYSEYSVAQTRDSHVYINLPNPNQNQN